MYKKTPVFIAAFLGMLLFGISLITLGSVTPHLKTKFMLDGIAAGTLFSILPVGILCGSLLFGPVCDRYGYKLLLILACIGMFAGFEGIAYASSLGILKICVFVFGAGGGVINGATNALVADISDEKKRSEPEFARCIFRPWRPGNAAGAGLPFAPVFTFRDRGRSGMVHFSCGPAVCVRTISPGKAPDKYGHNKMAKPFQFASFADRLFPVLPKQPGSHYQ